MYDMCGVVYCSQYCFFLFKRKTAYEMRISDWSSDVCSSDLIVDTLANTIGRAKLYVGRVSEQDDLGAPEPVDEGDPADVLDLLGTEDERSRMLASHGPNDGVAREGYLVGVSRGRLEGREDGVHADPRNRLEPTDRGRAALRERVCAYVLYSVEAEA